MFFARVCLSVCLLARLLKNVCMDFNEMLRVDRCQDMDELINFEPDPDHSLDAGTGLLSPISYRLQNFTALPRLKARCAGILRWKNPTYTYGRCVALERAVVLKWFYSLSRWKTFVGGKCALSSVPF